MYTKISVFGLTCLMGLLSVARASEDARLTDKTLVVWVSPADCVQTGGTALTVNDTTIDRFDGVVFGELEPKVWMAGSNAYSRTNKEQADWPKESIGPDAFVQMAIVYEGQQITMYRNGELYAEYTTSGAPYAFGTSTAILFGPRHLQKGVECFFGRIRDARVYAESLDREVIATLEPGRPVKAIEPWAWWDFSTTGTYDRAGRFNQVKLSGGARIDDGCLVLDGTRPMMLATIDRDGSNVAEVPSDWSIDDPVPAPVVQSTRLLREKLLDDPYRPGYHFCIPEDNGRPGDSNGCFYANGRYHLMYLYNRRGVGFSWGHISSNDLVHWRHHPDSIGPGDGDEGCFSGGGFVDDDGTAYLSYWMLWGANGIGIAKSCDRHYNRWQKLDANPVIQSSEWGITETTDGNGRTLIYGSADPTNIWKKNGKYYIGEYDTKSDRFIPDHHGRMTWVDNTYFAPEALVDAQGRQIMWSWLTDNPGGEEARGWSGVYGLPRSLWLGEDGTLHMRPVKELEMLRGDTKTWRDITIQDGETKTLEGVVGDSCELAITIDSATAKQFGVKVRAAPNGEEETLLYYDAEARTLCFDSTRSGIDGRRVLEQAPLVLQEGEPLRLRVFVDKSVVEIYANDRQAICRRVYPGRIDSLGMVLFARGGEVKISDVKAWEMMPSNPY